jgi:hypothetical protein
MRDLEPPLKQTVAQLCDNSVAMNRFVMYGDSMIFFGNAILICNILPLCGHVTPLAATSLPLSKQKASNLSKL